VRKDARRFVSYVVEGLSAHAARPCTTSPRGTARAMVLARSVWIGAPLPISRKNIVNYNSHLLNLC